MPNPTRVQIAGPLSPHAAGLLSHLAAQGYTPLSSEARLQVAAHLSRWLRQRGLQLADVSDQHVEKYIRWRRKAGRTGFLTCRSLDFVTGYLRAVGVMAPSKPMTPSEAPHDRLLWSYEQYLVRERSLVPTTVAHYRATGGLFLSRLFAPDSLDVDGLMAADVIRFVTHEARHSSVGQAQNIVTALRSFLRFLHVHGDLTRDLVGAVPAVAGRRLASLPKFLSADEIRRILATCDRRTHAGGRDHAVLLLLVRLGLRASEVAALQLDDVHWAQGEMVLRGKGRREARLPLPVDVGRALASYLRHHRPRAQCRPLFLRSRAPLRGVTRSAISDIVRRACRHAGLPAMGAHRLRHTAATQMLQRGASLSEIAQVLRHRRVDTTAIYAKVDRLALRTLALPWPGGAA
jgi:site-specific recombinase XerD